MPLSKLFRITVLNAMPIIILQIRGFICVVAKKMADILSVVRNSGKMPPNVMLSLAFCAWERLGLAGYIYGA